jgi:hypothetical protein
MKIYPDWRKALAALGIYITPPAVVERVGQRKAKTATGNPPFRR